jgi:DNA-directed RNA polymerase specialized sigma24 family protein
LTKPEKPVNTEELSAADVAKIISGIARSMKWRGLPSTVELDDLCQEAAISVFLSGRTGPAALIYRIAKNSMLNALRANGRVYRRDVQLEIGGNGAVAAMKSARDAFATLPVDDYRTEAKRSTEGATETLASRHASWERQRAADRDTPDIPGRKGLVKVA